ncbi:hypothetical protein B0H16DRAFT_1804567 [Mycena metata]|uniref:Uncharacterized protein n=1 Tax=Mycena metata TaxID=1033252 RepID=A0AAD7NJ80_9AGAR|nr:hypothetical protein B0H16DRAFT_1804567 [Mycena metata]
MLSPIQSPVLLIFAMFAHAALAQSLLAGYLGAYSAPNGTFIGAVARTLDLNEKGDRSDYLAAIGFTNATNEGDAVLLQILSPINPSVPWVAIVLGVAGDCESMPIPNGDAPWAAQLVPSDGSPLGPLPLPGDTRSTLIGGYNSLTVFCGEPMAFVIQSNSGRDILAPVWTDQEGTRHPMIIVHDITTGRVAVSPSLASYHAAATSPVTIEEVFFAFFT